MELKFLKEGTTTKEENGIKIEFGQITSSVQSLLITMANVSTAPGRTALASYVIKNILTKLTIDGKEYDPHQVATMSDLSDPDTVATFFKISHLVMSGIILGMDTKKKSEQQESPSEQEETASNAPGATEEPPLVDV
jgi:hypothetical protein